MSSEDDHTSNRFAISRAMQRRAHQIIPGGCHTYAKGDDQFPYLAPGFIKRGQGSHVWDVDGNEYVEYGMGCRSVGLGHAFAPVVEAVAGVLADGTNFSRPAALELECAEELLGMIEGAEMCKFAKDGSTITTAAFKLARAYTGREKIALCQDHPFFSIHDWFIGTTAINAGIPESTQKNSLLFRYNDIESLKHLFDRYPNQIACVILEPAKYADPEDNFLHKVQELCTSNGAIFVLDEMITGFRWHNGGAQEVYGIVPDLSAWGKALANGFSLSALTGKAKFMEASGLYHNKQRVFALSTTHGAESTGLAAAIATMRYYRSNPVIETLHQQGTKLINAIKPLIKKHSCQGYVDVIGRPCALVFTTRDQDGHPSQPFRTLLMQELIKAGVLGPSLIISYSHSDQDIAQTAAAFDAALPIYRKAIDEGVEPFLVGPPTQFVYSDSNSDAFRQRLDYLPNYS